VPATHGVAGSTVTEIGGIAGLFLEYQQTLRTPGARSERFHESGQTHFVTFSCCDRLVSGERGVKVASALPALQPTAVR